VIRLLAASLSVLSLSDVPGYFKTLYCYNHTYLYLLCLALSSVACGLSLVGNLSGAAYRNEIVINLDTSLHLKRNTFNLFELHFSTLLNTVSGCSL
jgi:hypothetical protein